MVPQKTARKINPQALATAEKKAKLVEIKIAMFFENYAKCGRLLPALDAAGLDHNVHYRRMQSSAEYRARFEECVQRTGQLLEDKAFELALDGDSHLLLPMLRRFKPEYRDKAAVEVTGTLDLVDKLAQARERMIPIDVDSDTASSDDSQVC